MGTARSLTNYCNFRHPHITHMHTDFAETPWKLTPRLCPVSGNYIMKGPPLLLLGGYSSNFQGSDRRQVDTEITTALRQCCVRMHQSLAQPGCRKLLAIFVVESLESFMRLSGRISSGFATWPLWLVFQASQQQSRTQTTHRPYFEPLQTVLE